MAIEHLRVSSGGLGSTPAPLIDARLHPPHLDRTTILARPRLEWPSAQSTPARLSLVIAPAGYGKTTIITERAHATRIPVAWLSLEPRDNHLRRLEEYLLATIATVVKHRIQPSGDRLDLTSESVAQHILAALQSTTAPILVVLDDLHHLIAADVLEALRIVLDYAPVNVSFLLASRTAPSLPLSLWRARGLLAELNADDLRFTPAETRVLCAQWLPAQLASSDLDLLVSSTQGWAAALRLIIMRLQQEPREQVSATLARLSASHRHLTDFLDQEILQALPVLSRSVMMRSSILDPICDDLCGCLLGNEYEPGTLEGLWRSGALITPLDEDMEWFRYHPFFARLLQQRLTSTHTAADIAHLHTRASLWWESNGHPAKAVDHAILAADWSRATQLISPLIATLESTQQLDLLRTWFDAFPTYIIHESPEFSYWYAWTLVRTGHLDAFEQHVANAEHHLNLQPDAPLLGVGESIRAVAAFYRGNGAACIAHAFTALDLLPPEATVERLWAEAALGLGESHTGRSALARTRLESFHTQAMGNSAMLPDTEVQTCWVMMMTGDTDSAQARLTQLVERHATERSDAIRRAFVMLADISIETAEYDAARSFLLAADERAARFGTFPLLADSRLRWARLYHRCGDLDQAIDSLTSMSGDATVVSNRRVQTQIGAHLASIWMDQGRTDESNHWVRSRHFEVTSALEFIDEAEYPIFVRWLMQHDRLHDARTIALGLSASAERDGRRWHLGQHLALLAILENGLGNHTAALSTTSDVLEIVRGTRTVTSLAMHGQSLLTLMDVVAPDGDYLDLVRRVRRLVGPADSAIDGSPASRMDTTNLLSAREHQVLLLIEAGYSNRAISDHLFIAVPTVKRHLTNIFHKLDATSRTDAIHKARERALI